MRLIERSWQHKSALYGTLGTEGDWSLLGNLELTSGKLTSEAVMPLVSSGFGDGSHPVYELVGGDRRVRVEVEFIRPDQPYPF